MRTNLFKHKIYTKHQKYRVYFVCEWVYNVKWKSQGERKEKWGEKQHTNTRRHHLICSIHKREFIPNKFNHINGRILIQTHTHTAISLLLCCYCCCCCCCCFSSSLGRVCVCVCVCSIHFIWLTVYHLQKVGITTRRK